jgi:antitoxin (DNA-binding transcriptional repressor) of toxin-antitoxin stability system
MTTYTYSQARQNFAEVLEKAKKEGKVLIKKRDGSSFLLSPLPNAESPLNVKGIKSNISSDEIIEILKEVRERQ